MDDLISRQEALKAVSWDTEAYMAINMLSSVQPEIIYCKNCKHLKRSETSSKLMMCQRWGRLLNLVGEFDFCSKAERRTDE